ncbi:MAG: cyclic nucleotide-binding domain-containing protein, partial [Gammaproteobacteria bacterium]|nr:cyclic nucleotide-binding domain-containing protein [Gammaproteobacteria bacterium]
MTSPNSASDKPTVINSQITKFLFSYGKKKEYEKGQYLISEGEASHTIFVVLDGEAEILKKDDSDQDNVVARVGSGTILGEMGVFMQENRTSSVRAASKVLALEFSAESFNTAIGKIPELGIRIINALSSKLKSSNEFVLGLRKAHNLMVVSNNILANEQLETVASSTKAMNSSKEFIDFTLDISELSREVAVGRRALFSEVDRLESAGILIKVNRIGGKVVGQTKAEDLIKFVNLHTYP